MFSKKQVMNALFMRAGMTKKLPLVATRVFTQHRITPSYFMSNSMRQFATAAPGNGMPEDFASGSS